MLTGLADVGRWLLRRPDVPPHATALFARRGTLAVPMVFSVLCVGEIVLFHLLIPWPPVRVIVDLIGLAGLLSVLAMAAAPAVRPHLLFADRLELRAGGTRCGTVPRDLIEDVASQRHLSPTAPEFETSEELPSPDTSSADGQITQEPAGTLILPGPDGTNVTVRLTEPVTLHLPAFGVTRATPHRVRRLRLHLDDPTLLRATHTVDV